MSNLIFKKMEKGFFMGFGYVNSYIKIDIILLFYYVYNSLILLRLQYFRLSHVTAVTAVIVFISNFLFYFRRILSMYSMCCIYCKSLIICNSKLFRKSSHS